ncbi:MAG TPA: TrkA family potassium uptake protein [Dehalococcoidia bacterium]|nr:TrkA family potassium uptake protein [Dehalococcoidia bacterium]
MYFIIVGGGKVGYYLSQALLSEGHEVLILEKDPARCGAICEQLGSVVVRGDGCEARTLGDAGTERADMLIAVTDEDEDNLVACQVAKHKFKVPRTIARINNPKNEALFKKLGIDVTISSTNIILEHIEEEVPIHPLVHLLTLKGGDLEVVEVNIPPSSSVVGKRMSEIDFPPDSVICLITGKSGAHVPTDDTILEADAQIVAVTKPEAEGALRVALTG